MTAKFIHTSDWQIGKVFRFVDSETMGLLKDARLRAISRLGELAVAHSVAHVLVAGDVYDMEALSPHSLSQPLERMRKYLGVKWHLLPGNHDPHRPNGLWDQVLRSKELPQNVSVHVAPKPEVLVDAGVVLLPAPLTHRHSLEDRTAYMDDVEVSEGLIRVGLAHGTVRKFGSADKDVTNFVAPDRPARAGLSYLAMGDWHGQKRINDRCWYSGTPEIDAFDVKEGGQALLVEIEGPQAIPAVTPIPTGQYNWTKYSKRINNRADIDHLAEELRRSADELDRVLVHLTVEGAISLENRRHFQEKIADGVSAAFCFMRIDDNHLFPQPTVEDLDRIDRGGFVRTAANELMRLAEARGGQSGIAAAALERLYIEHRKLQAEEQ